MKIDPYNHEEKYKKWKEKALVEGIKNISKKNSEIIMRYVTDMEHGLNVSQKSVKGCRSFIRLNTLREKMFFFARKFEEIYDLDNITEITEDQLVLFFSKMRKGEIARNDGKMYQSVNYFVKIIKAFWHWWQIVNKKQGKEIQDITMDLDTSKDKPSWVYLTEDQIKKLVDNASYEYKVLIMFLYDTGIRAPTELVNIKVSDFYNNFKELNIREEISKTFGRRIKLMICPELVKEYILDKKLNTEDYLFSKSPEVMNKYLKRLANRIFGDSVSPAGEKYSHLSMYDFRHCSCCYWLPRYKSESALKFRFGWKKSDKIHYYSEMLGMRDTISEEDLLVDLTKTEIERKLLKSENEKEIMQERVQVLEGQMKQILQMVNQSCFILK